MAAPMNAQRREALVKGASKAKIKAVVNLAACTGCEVCISACPVPTCIEPFGEDINSRGVYVNFDLCIGCMLCVKDCPWDTIKMVPTPTVQGHTTSLESHQDESAAIFENIHLLDERVSTPLKKGAKA
jgi:electron transport complex protein RnfB